MERDVQELLLLVRLVCFVSKNDAHMVIEQQYETMETSNISNNIHQTEDPERSRCFAIWDSSKPQKITAVRGHSFIPYAGVLYIRGL